MLHKTIVLLAALFVAGSSPVLAQGRSQTGTVQVRVVKMGFIVGGGGGEGALTYRGRAYPFTVGGLSAGVLGASVTNLTGRAYHLRRPEDIAGTYTALGGGVAVVGGVKFVRLRNSNGVVLELRGPQAGLEVSASLSGITIAMR
jgi:hypothetical protein